MAKVGCSFNNTAGERLVLSLVDGYFEYDLSTRKAVAIKREDQKGLFVTYKLNNSLEEFIKSTSSQADLDGVFETVFKSFPIANAFLDEALDLKSRDLKFIYKKVIFSFIYLLWAKSTLLPYSTDLQRILIISGFGGTGKSTLSS
jgi:hypothetical protein